MKNITINEKRKFSWRNIYEEWVELPNNFWKKFITNREKEKGKPKKEGVKESNG